MVFFDAKWIYPTLIFHFLFVYRFSFSPHLSIALCFIAPTSLMRAPSNCVTNKEFGSFHFRLALGQYTTE